MIEYIIYSKCIYIPKFWWVSVLKVCKKFILCCRQRRIPFAISPSLPLLLPPSLPPPLPLPAAVVAAAAATTPAPAPILFLPLLLLQTLQYHLRCLAATLPQGKKASSVSCFCSGYLLLNREQVNITPFYFFF